MAKDYNLMNRFFYCAFSFGVAAVWLVLSAKLANAAVLQTLYDTRVMVSGQTNASQNSAFRESLQQVLIKVSGDVEIADNAVVRQTLSQSRDFIRSFRYEMDNGLTFMLASFDEQRVNDLVINAGFPVWGKRRPDTLLWVAHWSQEGRRELLTAASAQLTKLNLLDAAERRGIPFTFPLMDIQDSELINVYDVWGRFDDTIKFASQRYPNDNLVSARIFDRNEVAIGEETVPVEMQWQLDWQILNQDLVQESTFFGSSMNSVIDQFVDFVADQLANKYAIAMTGKQMAGNRVNIKILNMDSIESYVTVNRFLESLAIVNSSSLLTLKGQEAEFQLDMSGSLSDLINTLLLDDKIARKTDAFGRSTDEMEFYWLP